MDFKHLNEQLEKFVEKINTDDDLEMDREDIEEIRDAITAGFPSFEYIDPDTNGTYKHTTCKAEKDEYDYNIILWKGYLYGDYKVIAKVVLKSYGKKVRVLYSLPYPGHGDFVFPRYMKKYAVDDDYKNFIISYFQDTKEEIIEDTIENLKRIFEYDRKAMENQEKLIPDFRKIQKDICHILLLKYKNEKEIDLSGKGFNITRSNGLVVPIDSIEVSIYDNKETLEQKCAYCRLNYGDYGFYFAKNDYECRHVRTPQTLETFKNLLKFLNGEDDKQALRKAKRQEYNKKRWAEKKAQKLADSKPFDKFLQELKDKYGQGYIAQDVYGYAYVYKNRPEFIPTVDYIDNNDEDVYEPGYWKGDSYDTINYEAKLNKAYKDQYRTSTPSAEKAIWSF